MKKKIDVSYRKYKIKKGDNVEVIAGSDSGRRGEVLSIDRQKGRVFVKDINLVKKTTPKTQENQKGGIIEKEASIDISNVMFVGKSGKPERIGRKVIDGVIKRYTKKSNEMLDK